MSETADELLDVLMVVEDLGRDGSVEFDECIEAMNEQFPGFWWRGGTCSLSSEVIMAPDYNDPKHGERLKTEYPLARCALGNLRAGKGLNHGEGCRTKA